MPLETFFSHAEDERLKLSNAIMDAIDPRAVWWDVYEHQLRITILGHMTEDVLSQGAIQILESNPFPVEISYRNSLPDVSYSIPSDTGTTTSGIAIPKQSVIVVPNMDDMDISPDTAFRHIQQSLKNGGVCIGRVNQGNLRQNSANEPKLRALLERAGFINIQFHPQTKHRLMPSKGMPLMPKKHDVIFTCAKPTSPEDYKGKPILFIVCGSPGSGKSTFAAQLLENGLVQRIVSVSDIRQEQTNHFAEFVPEEMENAYRESLYQVADALYDGNSVVWDATFTSREARNKIRALIEACMFPFIIVPVQLSTSPELTERRVLKRYNNHKDKDVTGPRARKLAEKYPAFPGAIHIDSTYPTKKGVALLTEMLRALGIRTFGMQ